MCFELMFIYVSILFAVSHSIKKTIHVNMGKFAFRVKLLQESYKLMEMKKLLRGYGIREVNLLNKEIMVSTLFEESFFSFISRAIWET